METVEKSEQIKLEKTTRKAKMLDTKTEKTIEGLTVQVSIPRLTGTSVFDGTLSDDQNTITGSLSTDLALGGLDVSLPGGDLTLERIVTDSDPCDEVVCDDGRRGFMGGGAC